MGTAQHPALTGTSPEASHTQNPSPSSEIHPLGHPTPRTYHPSTQRPEKPCLGHPTLGTQYPALTITSAGASYLNFPHPQIIEVRVVQLRQGTSVWFDFLKKTKAVGFLPGRLGFPFPGLCSAL